MSGRGSAWLRALAGLVAVPAALGATVAYLGWRYVRPTRWPEPDTSGAEPEELYFASLDGVRLRGMWLTGQEGYPTVILAHGYFRGLGEPFAVGLRLNRKGYNVFLFDFRACGKSEGRFTTIGAKETLDVLAAVRLVKGRGRLPIGVLGISMGAAAALMAAARSREIAALVADSAYADLDGLMRKKVAEVARWRRLAPLGWVSVGIGEMLAGVRVAEVRPIDFVDKISPRPILFIYGEKDTYVPWPQPQELFERAREPKEIWYAPGSDHAVAKDDHPDEYQRRVEEFFDRYLLSPALSLPALSSAEGSKGVQEKKARAGRRRTRPEASRRGLP